MVGTTTLPTLKTAFRATLSDIEPRFVKNSESRLTHHPRSDSPSHITYRYWDKMEGIGSKDGGLMPNEDAEELEAYYIINIDYWGFSEDEAGEAIFDLHMLIEDKLQRLKSPTVDGLLWIEDGGFDVISDHDDNPQVEHRFIITFWAPRA